MPCLREDVTMQVKASPTAAPVVYPLTDPLRPDHEVEPCVVAALPLPLSRRELVTALFMGRWGDEDLAELGPVGMVREAAKVVLWDGVAAVQEMADRVLGEGFPSASDVRCLAEIERHVDAAFGGPAAVADAAAPVSAPPAGDVADPAFVRTLVTSVWGFTKVSLALAASDMPAAKLSADDAVSYAVQGVQRLGLAGLDERVAEADELTDRMFQAPVGSAEYKARAKSAYALWGGYRRYVRAEAVALGITGELERPRG
jgi:hypothetical protein